MSVLGNTTPREIKKSSKLEHVCYDIRGPVLRAANEMEEAGHKIIKLNIGNPAHSVLKRHRKLLMMSH